MWEQGNVNELLHEAMANQKFCKSSPHSYRLLGKHKNFHASSIKETWTLPWILPINKDTLALLKQKHPKSKHTKKSSSYRHTRGDSPSKVGRHIRRKYLESSYENKGRIRTFRYGCL